MTALILPVTMRARARLSVSPPATSKLHPAFREDAHPHRPRARFCYPFHQLSQPVILTQAGAERASRSRSPRRDPSIVIHLPQPPYTAFATSTRSAVFPFYTAVSFCSTSHIRSAQHVRVSTASASLHSPITCHGVSSVPVHQKHDEESSLPKRRCSNSLQAKSPHTNFTPRTRSNTPLSRPDISDESHIRIRAVFYHCHCFIILPYERVHLQRTRFHTSTKKR
jgi:hypothetical protein